MFGVKYSRLKFWIISFSLLIILVFVNFFAKLFADIGQNTNAIFLYGISLVISLSWINTLANRIRDYGSNPWLALWALLPLVNIVLAFYYGIVKTKNKEIKTEEVDSNTSLPKAVYNHSKDIVNEIKPAINEYKEKHSTTKDENQITETINSEITEDEIYEKIMIEIEENKKVKSTWAKALSQSEGDDKKANSLYINLRVQEIKIDLNKEIERLKKSQEEKSKINITENLQFDEIIEKTELLKEEKDDFLIYKIIGVILLFIIMWSIFV